MNRIILKKGKEKSVLHMHPWIFSGAIVTADVSDGELAAVCANDGTVLAWGYYNSRTDIAVRLLTFGDRKPDTDLFVNRVRASLTLREVTGITQCTNAYRLIHSEGDMLPGLIVDWYNGHCIMQSLTSGMDKLKVTIAQIINDLLKPESIYERSDHEGRKKEGLQAKVAQVYGHTPEIIEVYENGMLFVVDVRRGQKTGFFCDQRDNRKKVKEIAKGRDVLNLFSYTGGFSVAALLGGAKSAASVDGSGSALEIAHRNCQLNNVAQAHEIIKADVFDYINTNDITQNFIICDPPALAKNKTSVKNAARGYKELNLKIISKCPANSFLLTCSCSRFIDHKLFQQIVFAACNDAGRYARIAGRYSQPADHPVSIYCPETEYLKALLLYIY
ncbi:MAG: class I SAM-dependent rRNA methyltransferase [Spirochaetota bacterium]